MKKKISGWSEYKHYSCEIFTPNNITQLKNFINENSNKKKVITRGHGCSFGDQAVISEGIVIDTKNINKIINYNKNEKTIEVEAGAKLSDILTLILQDDLVFQSIPGGLDITVAGAISNNVHGKDCFKKGYFNQNVNKIRLLLSSGDLIEISKNNHDELFKNIFSSLGLFGIICSIELNLVKIKSPMLETETSVAKNKKEMENFFLESSKTSDYLIAWLDCSAKNNKVLRGICRKAKFIENKQISIDQNKKYKDEINKSLKNRFKNNLRKFFFNIVWFIIGNTVGSKFFYFFNFISFNLFKFLGRRKKNVLLNEFTLLHEKYLPDYNNIFKKNGFIAIQPFFNNINPFDKIEEVIVLCQKYSILPIWCPIKKYKDGNINYLGFGGDGYSIVLEFSPHEIGLKKSMEFIKELENLIINQKGKIYLAKDQVISKEAFRKMFPEYIKFLSLKKKYDKSNLFISEQYTRLLT